jgi:hypothetical protein
MLTLTTPISMPNITRVEVYDQSDKRDSRIDPRFELCCEYKSNVAGARSGGTFCVVARDVGNSTRVHKNPTPAAYGDIVLVGAVDIPGACTALAAAYDGATGTRAAKREAAYAAAVALGLVSADLSAT